MNKYIKNGVIFNTPIKIEKNGKISYTNDESFILANGYEKYVFVEPKKTLEELIEISNKRINKKCDKKILNDFVWHDE